MNLRDQINDFRDDMNLDDRSDFTDNEIVRLLNRAGRQIVKTNGRAIERQYSFPVVADQESYALPSDFYDIRLVKIDNDDRLNKVDISFIEDFASGRGASGKAFEYAIWQSKLFLKFVPGSDAISTVLSGGIAANPSSVVVVTPSDSLPDRGTILVDSEKLYYEHKVESGSVTTLSVITGGCEDTVAASHSDGAGIVLCNVEMRYYALFRDNLFAPDGGKVDNVTGGGSLEAGKHFVLWTYYNSNTGIESYPCDLYVVASAVDERLLVSSLSDDGDLAQLQKRIYVSKSDLTQPYYLAATLDAGTTEAYIDVADAALAGCDIFEWDSVGGGNLPEELLEAQGSLAIKLYLFRSKRFDEAGIYEQAFWRYFNFGMNILKSRRSVNVKARRPDIVF